MRGGPKVSLAILFAGLSVADATSVHAAGLSKDACYELRVELGVLRAAGAEEDMKRGPEWAKVNLTREELKNVQRLVEVEEQLRFRCGSLRGRLVAKKPRVKPVPDTPMRKPALAKAKVQKAPPAIRKAAASPPARKTVTSTPRKKTSLRRRKKRSRARIKDAYASPNEAVNRALTPYSGFR